MCFFWLACVWKWSRGFLSITIIFSTVERVSESKSESLLFSGSTLEVLISGSPTITFFHHSIWLHLVSNTDTVLPSSARVTKYPQNPQIVFPNLQSTTHGSLFQNQHYNNIWAFSPNKHYMWKIMSYAFCETDPSQETKDSINQFQKTKEMTPNCKKTC